MHTGLTFPCEGWLTARTNAGGPRTDLTRMRCGRTTCETAWLRLRLRLRLRIGVALCGALLNLTSAWSAPAMPADRTIEAASWQRAEPSRSVPRTLRELLAFEPSALGSIDIARVNLLCTDSLPGSAVPELEQALAVADDWASRVRDETARHWRQFDRDPAQFNGSQAYFRILTLVTVLQQDCGIRYQPRQILKPDYKDSQDLFLSGLLGNQRRGTCVSLPVLYVAVGRRLGYPLRLATAKGHVFARWEGQGERLNIEATGQGLSCFPDAYYHEWPVAMTEAERVGGAYLVSLDPAGELALFLSARGHCLQAEKRLPESQLAHAFAHVLAPRRPDLLAFLAGAVAEEMPDWRRVRVDLGLAGPGTPQPRVPPRRSE